jgi:hypothetical protein
MTTRSSLTSFSWHQSHQSGYPCRFALLMDSGHRAVFLREFLHLYAAR